MTRQFFAIAATLLERGAAHSRYRAELIFALADDATAALAALREQVAEQRPGWSVVSTAIRAVPERNTMTRGESDEDARGQGTDDRDGGAVRSAGTARAGGGNQAPAEADAGGATVPADDA